MSRDGLNGMRGWRRAFGTEKKINPRVWRGADVRSVDQHDRWEERTFIDTVVERCVVPEIMSAYEDVAWFAAAPGGRRLKNLGAPPETVQRSAWIARFNPGLSLGRRPVFNDSDPVSFYPWDDPEAAVEQMLLSAWPGHTTQTDVGEAAHTKVMNAVRDIAVGDLVFVLRAKCTDRNRTTVRDPRGWKAGAHLVGLTWVSAKASTATLEAHIGEVHCAPMVKFTEPVHVGTARKWVGGLSDVAPLKQPGGVAALTEGEAFAVAAACSLPMEIFTVHSAELPAMAADLRRLSTGPVQPMRDYAVSARARYERVRNIEVAAMTTVQDQVLRSGMSFADLSALRGIGYDLAVGFSGLDRIEHEIEVKGTDAPTTGSIRVTSNEMAAAMASAEIRPERWRLEAVTRACEPSSRAHHVVTATEVADGWTGRISDAKSASGKPLKRLARLPATDWVRP